MEHDKWQARIGSIPQVFAAAAKDMGCSAVDRAVVKRVWERLLPGLLQVDLPVRTSASSLPRNSRACTCFALPARPCFGCGSLGEGQASAWAACKRLLRLLLGTVLPVLPHPTKATETCMRLLLPSQGSCTCKVPTGKVPNCFAAPAGLRCDILPTSHSTQTIAHSQWRAGSSMPHSWPG